MRGRGRGKGKGKGKGRGRGRGKRRMTDTVTYRDTGMGRYPQQVSQDGSLGCEVNGREGDCGPNVRHCERGGIYIFLLLWTAFDKETCDAPVPTS